MACLGLEPGPAGWRVQMNPLSYGGTPKLVALVKFNLKRLRPIRMSNKGWTESGAVVVAQLVERSLSIPEVRGSNPVIGKILYWTFTVNCIEKTKIKKKRPGMAHF